MLPALERRHEVLAPTLPGHAGAPPLGELHSGTLADAVEQAMDEAGFETAHVAGNSLGGHVALAGGSTPRRAYELAASLEERTDPRLGSAAPEAERKKAYVAAKRVGSCAGCRSQPW